METNVLLFKSGLFTEDCYESCPDQLAEIAEELDESVAHNSPDRLLRKILWNRFAIKCAVVSIRYLSWDPFHGDNKSS